ncbi:glutamic-type intramembrane protease PrsW [Pseudalkalibacillus caeni]|uniref:Protease PrsW n=1 Tax=Exobacillus caeni TaxID=2574798 RepID=A0A5R9EYU1_9BACL|nr:glutamic-type intramembrane protease PrsW [Pseudalkalibacillus caeni]TLS35609.1 intramembrane metalloprotease PrsW [Pseudalkalibacillus caeni]
MVAIISAGIAPGIALLCYFYLKDQYESEPIGMVLRSFIFGALLVFPVMVIQYGFTEEKVFVSDLAEAYVMSGFLEEFLKWFILYFTVYMHFEFNEFYDGIVYAVAISLGFASVENVFFLIATGIDQALGRALLPVSSHALYGVIMGSYLGRAKMDLGKKKGRWILLSLLFPIVLHGTYDFILLTVDRFWIYLVPFMLVLWAIGLRKVKVANLNQAKVLKDQESIHFEKKEI